MRLKEHHEASFKEFGALRRKLRVHRFIYESHFGKITNGFEIHHIDRNPKNNDISNLIMLPQQYHVEIHKKMKKYKYTMNKKEIVDGLKDFSLIENKNRFSAKPLCELNVARTTKAPPLKPDLDELMKGS